MIKQLFCVIILLSVAACVNATAPDESSISSNLKASGTLPVLHIETEDMAPIVSKEIYLNASYWLDPMGMEAVQSVGTEAEPLPMQIRGRGHSSWKGAKKPYKIKLGKKTSLLGMPKNKHWALLKPSENTVAGLQIGRLMDLDWTPSFRPIEVVLNGDYIGLYFLTETIRIDENRVNIYEQQDQETNPELVTGGWLVEVDNYRDDCQITIPENERVNLTLRYHSPEDLSDIQLRWLTDEFKSMNASIYSSDKTSADWEKYIDVETMARYFIVQEVMDNPDGFHGSFYLHKDLAPDAKWIAGPIWDLVCYYREKTDYSFRMQAHYSVTSHWIGEIIQYDSFCKAVEKAWQEVYPTRLSEIFGFIDETILPLSEAWSNDCKRWDGDPAETSELRAERIKGALRRNMEWFDSHLPESPYTSVESLGQTSQIPVAVHNLQGIRIGVFEDQEMALSELKTGVYIINGKKIKIL